MSQIIWDLTPLAKNDTDKELDKKMKVSKQSADKFVASWEGRQDYLQDPAILKTALDEYETIMRHHGLNTWAGYYYDLRLAQDQLDTKLKGLAANSEQHTLKLVNSIQFFSINISKIPVDKHRQFLDFADLKDYRHFLQQLFNEGRFTLSEPEEKILNLVSSTSYEAWVKMTSSLLASETADIKQNDESTKSATLPEIISLTSHANKAVRDSAADAVNTVMAKYTPIATEEINAILGFKKSTDDLRQFSRPDAARHLSDDIDSSVVDALLTAVETNFDIAQRFYSLKAKLFGRKHLEYHERNLEYGQLLQTYTYDQSVDLVKTVFNKLDPQFGQFLTSFNQNGQIDVYPRPGKSGGAFCAHRLITQPTYVLLNHTDRLQDVLTLAHEMGHAINNELMRAKQNALNFGTPLATAEVASTFMEDFVLEHLAQNVEPAEQLAINMMKLNDDISSIFRQVAAYRFEQKLHASFRQSGYLSQQEIGSLFSQNMAAYMGSAIEQSEGSQNWWVYWSHFRSFFYVYSYASGLLISKSLQSMVRKQPQSISRVKEFLSIGSSASPSEAFMALDIDIAKPDFWQQGLNEIGQLLAETEQLANQIGKEAIQPYR